VNRNTSGLIRVVMVL